MNESKNKELQSQHNTKNTDTFFGISMIIFGIIGWFASFMLATEYVRTLQNPDYIPGCSVSKLVSCSPNMASWQGSVFGFSNTFIGVAAFVIPIVLGVLILTGVKFQKWIWIGYKIGMGLAFISILWLAYQSIFNLNVLCPWCMVVWTVVTFMFWGVLFRKPHLSENEEQSELHNWNLIASFFTIVTIAVIAQIHLDWLPELFRLFQ